jgi:hypothetical protein
MTGLLADNSHHATLARGATSTRQAMCRPVKLAPLGGGIGLEISRHIPSHFSGADAFVTLIEY